MIWQLIVCMNMNFMDICGHSVYAYYPDEESCYRASERFTPSSKQRIDYKICSLRPALFPDNQKSKP